MRNLNKPNRYNVASIQAQQTLGGDVMQSDEEGQYVTWRDYKWLLESYTFVQDQYKDLNTELEHQDLFKSVIEKFFNSADLKNQPDTQSCYALAEKLKQLPDCILDFTEEQVRDNPAWALAVFRHKVKEMQYKRVHDLNAIGGEQEENARLKAEVERLRKAGDGMAEVIWLSGCVSGMEIKERAVKAWNAAKEGKQS